MIWWRLFMAFISNYAGHYLANKDSSSKKRQNWVVFRPCCWLVHSINNIRSLLVNIKWDIVQKCLHLLPNSGCSSIKDINCRCLAEIDQIDKIVKTQDTLSETALPGSKPIKFYFISSKRKNKLSNLEDPKKKKKNGKTLCNYFLMRRICHILSLKLLGKRQLNVKLRIITLGKTNQA